MPEQIESAPPRAVLVHAEPMPRSLRRRDRQALGQLPRVGERGGLALERRPSRRTDAPGGDPARGQALVGVVGAQVQPVLGARGEHPVRLGHPAGDQVVDHDADVGLAAVEDEGRALERARSRVDARDETLARRFLVARRAVDLPGEEQARQRLQRQPAVERARVDVVVLDRVAWLNYACVFKTLNRPDIGLLNLLRQGGRDAVRVDRAVVEALGLEEDLVLNRVRRSAPPCPRSTGNSAARRRRCDRRTSPTAPMLARMMSCVRGLVAVTPQAICRCTGASERKENITGSSSPGWLPTASQSIVRPSSRGGVPVLRRPSGSPRPAMRSASRTEAGSSAAAGLAPDLADVDHPAEEGAGGQDDGAGADHGAVRQDDAGDRAAFDNEVDNFSLDEPTGRSCERTARCTASRYRARSACARGPCAAGPLRRLSRRNWMPAKSAARAHDPVHGVDLADDVALAETADRGVAGHLAQAIEAMRDEDGARAHPGRGATRPPCRHARHRRR